MFTGKARHCMQFRLSCLTEPVSIHYKSMLALKLATKDLKKDHLKSVKHLAIFSKSIVSVSARKVQKTAFVIPFSRDIEIKPHFCD